MNSKLLSGLLVLCMSASVFALADNYKPVRIELAACVPVGFGDPTEVGFGFLVEPKLNITDQISAGLRAQWGFMIGSDDDGVSFSGFGAYILKGEYFFNTETVRPFAGAGVGLYSLAGVGLSATAEEGSVSAVAGNFFGVVPALGINLGGFRLAANMNLVFAKQHVWTVDANTQQEDWKEESKLRPILSLDFGGSIMGKRR